VLEKILSQISQEHNSKHIMHPYTY